jgi:hypothetical protein
MDHGLKIIRISSTDIGTDQDPRQRILRIGGITARHTQQGKNHKEKKRGQLS